MYVVPLWPFVTAATEAWDYTSTSEPVTFLWSDFSAMFHLENKINRNFPALDKEFSSFVSEGKCWCPERGRGLSVFTQWQGNRPSVSSTDSPRDAQRGRLGARAAAVHSATGSNAKYVTNNFCHSAIQQISSRHLAMKRWGQPGPHTGKPRSCTREWLRTVPHTVWKNTDKGDLAQSRGPGQAFQGKWNQSTGLQDECKLARARRARGAWKAVERRKGQLPRVEIR